MKRLLLGLLLISGVALADTWTVRNGERLALPIKQSLQINGMVAVTDSLNVTVWKQGATAATKYRAYSYTNALASTGWFDTAATPGTGNTSKLFMNVWTDSLGLSAGEWAGLNVTVWKDTLQFEQVFSINCVDTNSNNLAYRGAAKAIKDSTAALSTLVDTLPEAVWFFDSAAAAGFAATDMGRQLTKDVTATTDTLATARAVWRQNLATWSPSDSFGKAAKYMILAGDSTTYVGAKDVWDVNYDTAGRSAGSMGDSLNNPSYIGNVWTIAGSTDTTHNVGSTEAQRLRNMFRSATGAPMYLTYLGINGANGANGSLYINNTTGPGIFAQTSALGYDAIYALANHGGNGAGFHSVGPTGGGYGMWLEGKGSTGHGLYTTASGSSGNGIYSYGGGTSGVGATFYGSASHGLVLRAGGNGSGLSATGNGSGSGFSLTGGSTGYGLSSISSGNYGIFAQGNAAGLLGYSPTGIGLYGWGSQGVVGQSDVDGGAGFRGGIDTTYAGGSGSGGADTATMKIMATNNPDLFYGPTSSGSLTYTVTVFVVDTGASPDDSLQSIYVSLADNNGALVSWGKTDQSGKALLGADAGSYTVRIFHPPYSLPTSAITVSADDTVTVSGYNSVTGQLCRVWGTISGPNKDPLQYVRVTFTMPEGVNVSDSTILMGRTVAVETDEDGIFSVDLIRSTYLSNKAWNATVEYPGLSTLKRSITVPDTTSYRVNW